MYSFKDEFLGCAAAQAVATIAMKVFALGRLARLGEAALRYTLGLPVSMVVVGCSSLAQLEDNVRIAERFTPLDAAERQELYRFAEPMATPANIPWKSPDWGKSGRWIKP
jgi:aryl-alcohol dehydrogenase-like predicted oxidoreductase